MTSNSNFVINESIDIFFTLIESMKAGTKLSNKQITALQYLSRRRHIWTIKNNDHLGLGYAIMLFEISNELNDKQAVVKWNKQPNYLQHKALKDKLEIRTTALYLQLKINRSTPANAEIISQFDTYLKSKGLQLIIYDLTQNKISL